MDNSSSIKNLNLNQNLKIAIIGLGYVGLPLSITFANKYKVIGFDKSIERIEDLKNGFDRNNELNKSNLENKNISFSSDEKDLDDVNIFIITVPTPVDSLNQPDFKYLIDATNLISKFLKKNSFIIYESTVYPGATEEVCLPIILKSTELIFNKDFFLGYSPERVNPGDKEKTIKDIIKITSGSSEYATNFIDKLYSSVISAGTFKVDSIKVAEAAKLIENIQRDVNIALINELSKIFYKLNIDTNEVIEASSTKWNFHKYKPGLVGGHCIGIDPFYMSYLCQKIDHNPVIIASGRKINDSMARDAANRFFNLLNKKFQISNFKILIIGITFKENCNDIRNSKVFDLINSLKDLGCLVDVTDEVVDSKIILEKKDLNLLLNPPKNTYDGIILAVPHLIYLNRGINYLKSFGKKDHIFFDLRGVFKKNQSDLRL